MEKISLESITVVGLNNSSIFEFDGSVYKIIASLTILYQGSNLNILPKLAFVQGHKADRSQTMARFVCFFFFFFFCVVTNMEILAMLSYCQL